MSQSEDTTIGAAYRSIGMRRQCGRLRQSSWAVQLKLAAVEGPSILQLPSTASGATIHVLSLELAFAAEASPVGQAAIHAPRPWCLVKVQYHPRALLS